MVLYSENYLLKLGYVYCAKSFLTVINTHMKGTPPCLFSCGLHLSDRFVVPWAILPNNSLAKGLFGWSFVVLPNQMCNALLMRRAQAEKKERKLIFDESKRALKN